MQKQEQFDIRFQFAKEPMTKERNPTKTKEIYRSQPNLRSKSTLSVTYKSGIPIENLILHRLKDYTWNRV